jgi:hypothetical protein
VAAGGLCSLQTPDTSGAWPAAPRQATRLSGLGDAPHLPPVVEAFLTDLKESIKIGGAMVGAVWDDALGHLLPNPRYPRQLFLTGVGVVDAGFAVLSMLRLSSLLILLLADLHGLADALEARLTDAGDVH